MSLFNKFFQTHLRKNSRDTSKRQHCTQDHSLFPFSSEQVRVLLFRECDWTDRRLLFDSSAIEKVSVPAGNQTTKFDKLNGQKSISSNNSTDSTQSSFIDMCNGYGYTYHSAANDGSNIGEMVFGSVAMSFEGTSLKVHWLQNPKRILCSQVFLSPTPSKQSFQRNNSMSGSSSNDHSTYNLKSTKSVKKLSDSFSLPLTLCLADKLNNDLSSTIPLDVPLSLDHNSFEISGCDSGYSGIDIWAKMSNSSYHPSHSNGYSTASIFGTDPSIASSRKFSIDSAAIFVDPIMNSRNSDGCLQRRILRNLSTSFENSWSRNDVIGYFDEYQILSNRSNLSIPNSIVRRHSDHHGESISNPEMATTRNNIIKAKDSLKASQVNFSSHKLRTKSSQRRSKIGLAVCIRFSESVEDEMQSFCSEHIALLESMLCRLRADAELAYGNQKRFHQLMLHAWFAASSWVTDLFTAPRIHEPVWLSLSNGYIDQPNNLAKRFMTELCWLLNSADTKDTNFFISTLLTAILTNHLGWVATVAPIINSLPCNNDHVFQIHQSQEKMIEISKFHPYNVLWAQLSDLYGSIGCPSRLAKTIICGTKTLTINKVLNVLTYFVRCGEIQRVDNTRNVLNNLKIENIIARKSDLLENLQCSPSSKVQAQKLSRNESCFKDLSNISDQIFKRSIDENGMNYSFYSLTNERRSKELLNSLNNTIKLMVTNPHNTKSEYETASDALEFIIKNVESRSIELNQETKELSPLNTMVMEKCLNSFGTSVWSIDTIADGIAFEICKATNTKPNESGKNELKRSQSFNEKPNKIDDELRKSRTLRQMSNDLNENAEITIALPDFVANNMMMASDDSKSMQKSDIKQNQSDTSKSVVFVLGDDDVLFDLKASTKTLNIIVTENISEIIEKPKSQMQAETEMENCGQTLSSTAANINNEAAFMTASNTSAIKPEKKKKHCTHKKHSGVKFNFEQYPQIVTNYMKNKNLDIESYDFLEKGLKLEQENAFNYGASSSILPKVIPDDIQELEEQEEEEQCECCANTFRILQTPSNATELEFSSEDGNYPVPINNIVNKPIEKLTSVIDANSQIPINQTDVNESEFMNTNENSIGKNVTQSNETTAEKYGKYLELLTIPMPETNIISNSKTNRIRAGYVPSLFVGITDHFIPDMVLQGITSPLAKWEPILKQNLTLSSHCATFEQIPTENVAILANVDKWDVSLVTSQSFALAAKGLNGPIGMSQLVSTMLESVHAMWLAGTPAYQCMSFMESKLKEIYLQSEALAAFLLATEFCSLNTVTSALNLSANDVPLLLSVASIHSPQLTKKYFVQ